MSSLKGDAANAEYVWLNGNTNTYSTSSTRVSANTLSIIHGNRADNDPEPGTTNPLGSMTARSSRLLVCHHCLN